MQTQGDDPECDDAHDDMTEGFGEQVQERTVETLDLVRVVVEAGLQDEPTDDHKYHPTREHPETAQRDDDVSHHVVHLGTLEVSLEYGPVGLDELSKADAERAVETMIDSIVSSLKSGDEVSIAGLGIFATKARPARQGRNPRTGKEVRIPPGRTIRFKPGKDLQNIG